MLWRVSYDVSAEVAALIENYRCGRKIKQTCLDVLSALLLFEQKYKSNKTPGLFLSCFHQLHRYKTLIMCVFINILLLGVTSPRGGGAFGGLSPPNKTPSPPNWNTKHYKSVEILSMFRVSSPPAQTQSTPAEMQRPLLKTFWRRFCAGCVTSSTNFSKGVATKKVWELTYIMLFISQTMLGKPSV